jgi:poly-gamma-glutamate capsule biosynthesis protein CapA/YwtB (metallophosphatase superfamily)
MNMQKGAGERLLFLAGDVMVGRGIDQLFVERSDPRLFESFVKDARDYVALAAVISGNINIPVPAEYIWGDALEILRDKAPDVSIVNLETSITLHNTPWPDKGINYRMHPANVACLRAAELDCCVLANNHVLDWEVAGLLETLDVLHQAGIVTAGAGTDSSAAKTPAAIELGSGTRLLVFAYGLASSGVPASWAASADHPGVNFLLSPSLDAAESIIEDVSRYRKNGDLVIVSLHWGPNWGYEVAPAHVQFARNLAESGLINVIHGHSSHHPIGIEVHRGTLILYGSGDLLNDYEGIRGHEAFRPNLVLMYWVRLEVGTGRLTGLSMTPMVLRHLKLNRAQPTDAKWLADVLGRASQPFGTQIVSTAGGELCVEFGVSA